jgi:hypothetical protein
MDEKLVNFRKISFPYRRKAPRGHKNLPGAIVGPPFGNFSSYFPPEG